MKCILSILGHLLLTKWAFAEVTYFQNSYVEIQPEDWHDKTDFGFSMGYSATNNELVIGAPHHDLNGKVFKCPMADIFKFENKTAKSSEITIDMEKLAGDYSRELAPDHHFCLGSSISVATDFILTCAPLWRTVINSDAITSKKSKYGTYGKCFVITETGVSPFNGVLERLSEILKDSRKATEILEKVHGGSGWSTMVDENNNLTLISLSPFTPTTDIGYTNSLATLDSMKLMNVYDSFNHLFKNIGKFISGKFFEDKMVTYAFSGRKKDMRGFIAFLQRPTKADPKWEVSRYDAPYPLYIDELKSDTGSMFGAALAAADFNSDGFSDLLVGAPAQGGADSFLYDSGALHIFLGGAKKKITERRSIVSTVSKGYFGSTIATNDVDGDGLSEIFVSAPFEDSGKGALYILNGQDIKNFVKNNNPSTVKTLADFKFTQRLQNKNYEWFGYSLQPLPDLDGNGWNELAIGAPKSGKVLLYRSIPTIIINVIAEIDRDYVQLTDQSCVIFMKIDITYPKKPETISETLTVTMKVEGNDISLAENSFDLSISRTQSRYDKNITVSFSNTNPGLNLFEANVALAAKDSTKGIKKPRVGISPYSTPTTSVQIRRRCKDKDCVPVLSANIEFSGGDVLVEAKEYNLRTVEAKKKHYILGSSETETVSVTVINRGNDTYDSCFKIYIKGSEVLVKIDQDSANRYIYMLPQPFANGATNTEDILLDMTKQSNLDKELFVRVDLHNICTRNVSSSTEARFPFGLSTKELFVDGFSNMRNITDTEISDSKLISDSHIYTVVNKGNVTWKSINAVIKITKKEVISGYHILKSKSIICNETNETNTYTFSCQFDLERSLRIVITLDIAKDKFKSALTNEQLITTSNFELNLGPNDKKVNEISTIFVYKVDTTLGQNKLLIIILAIVFSTLIWTALTYILYKRGFFKSAEKTKMEEIKNKICQQIIEENATPGAQEINEVQRASEGNRTSEDQKTSEGHRESEGHRINRKHETNEGRISSKGHGVNMEQDTCNGLRNSEGQGMKAQETCHTQ